MSSASARRKVGRFCDCWLEELHSLTSMAYASFDWSDVLTLIQVCRSAKDGVEGELAPFECPSPVSTSSSNLGRLLRFSKVVCGSAAARFFPFPGGVAAGSRAAGPACTVSVAAAAAVALRSRRVTGAGPAAEHSGAVGRSRRVLLAGGAAWAAGLTGGTRALRRFGGAKAGRALGAGAGEGASATASPPGGMSASGAGANAWKPGVPEILCM
mmetsp:Transcript_8946/g.18047  ORF Transcript_8946/g.18047 Transcript_8946/m.18047 type:complete len:213 (+) Transcript_8946:227-865(+)